MKKPALFITFIAIIVIFLSIVQIVVSNRLSTTGVLLSKLEEDIDYYDKQNSLLEEQLLLSSSLNHIASGALEKGFVKDNTRIFLTTPLPLAVRQ
ncbi:hypothetical protein C4559_02630 [Candidatus Microgenomates bacterium]|nr:MAG: hypothetical protein C4559_02630 [Candidatus Microgenomates bacterium]